MAFPHQTSAPGAGVSMTGLDFDEELRKLVGDAEGLIAQVKESAPLDESADGMAKRYEIL